MSEKKKTGKAAIVAIVVIAILAALLIGVLVFGGVIGGKSRYPLEHEELVLQYANEYGLDPYFVAAVINAESGFDEQAVSRVGAMGLMQIMPETGEWIAGKLDIEEFDESSLFDSETNIRFGCWYLNFLNDKFDGNKQLMMAGYNAGHNRVAQWLEDKEISDGKNLTDIPFEETDKYVKKVSAAYEKYKEYYGEELGSAL